MVMKVNDLIKLLQQQDQNQEVDICVYDTDEQGAVVSVHYGLITLVEKRYDRLVINAKEYLLDD